MCGIWAFLNKNNKDLNTLFKNFMNIKHRGPDYSSFQIYNDVVIGFHRLAIMDLSFSSNQPYILKQDDRTIVFVCNGEIYNYQELINNYDLKIDNKSDCLTIPHLYLNMEYNEWIQMFTDEIKGEFAFLLFEFDKSNKLVNLVSGRDALGIRPLYWSEKQSLDEEIVFSSEIKGCDFTDLNVTEFKPGHIVSLGKQNSIYDFKDIYSVKQLNSLDSEYLSQVKESVINSVKRRLDADQPIAFLLSGGVDSSIVASIAAKLSPNKIRTFCCGMEGGSDLAYAKMVAEHISSDHTEVIFTKEEALDVINDVIYTTETWDTTTIRASVGQYLVSKYISENTNAKVLFVGEGPDEVCSSYLFNWYAPDSELIHPSAMDYVNNIYYYDVKRCDRCIARWGLEARVALLDPEFIKAYWKIPSHERFPKTRNIEKWWFRKAFDIKDTNNTDDNYLPDAVLWRKKEAFSDGVSSTKKSWFQIIQEHLMEKYNMCEKDYFKSKFIEFFGEKRLNVIPDYWQPRWNKNGELITSYVDPSARTLDIYNENNLSK